MYYREKVMVKNVEVRNTNSWCYALHLYFIFYRCLCRETGIKGSFHLTKDNKLIDFNILLDIEVLCYYLEARY